MRFALDSNILIYSLVRDDSRHALALELVSRSVEADLVLPIQVLGEFLNVIRRKFPQSFEEAWAQAERLSALIAVVETKGPSLLAGARLAAEHGLQFWDSVLCEVARSAGAKFLLSEDMQDGRELNGLRILNPFRAHNAASVAELLMPVES